MKKNIFFKILLISIITFTLYYSCALRTAAAMSSQKTKEAGTVSIASLKAKNKILEQKLKELSPKGIYIVVDTAKNELYLKNGGKTLKQAVISSGSGNILEDSAGKRSWIFDTPKGVYSVRAKVRNPVWIKPDWAFIEEGEPVPDNAKERLEPNVLGDYALGFGNGYFIHGTLYTRLLGRNVTHGCVRVGDEDLKTIYKAAPIGASIVIY